MDNYPAEDRGGAFYGGVQPSESLSYLHHRINARVPKMFTPNGVHQQISFSGIGSSATDMARLTLGSTPISGSLPTANGSSVATNEARRAYQSRFANAQY